MKTTPKPDHIEICYTARDNRRGFAVVACEMHRPVFNVEKPTFLFLPDKEDMPDGAATMGAIQILTEAWGNLPVENSRGLAI